MEKKDYKLLLLEKVVSSMNDSISVVDSQTKEIIYTNRSLLEILGYDLKEVGGNTAAFLASKIHPDDLKRALQSTEKLKQDENAVQEIRVMDSAGKWRWIWSRANTIHIEEGDNHPIYFDVSQDVSVLKNYEQTLKAIIEAIPDVVVKVDKTGTVLDFYPNQLATSEMETLQIVGKNALELMPKEEAVEIVKHIEKAIETNHIQRHEHHAEYFGKEVWLEFRFSRLNENEVLAVARNITEVKTTSFALDQKLSELFNKNVQLEKYITSNSELEKFAYIVSHDLREPIRSIVGFAQLLERRNQTNIDQDSKEFIEQIINGAQRMSTLVHGLLDYSRINSDTKVFSELDLNKLVKKVINDLKTSISESQAEIVSFDLPVIHGDEIQIRQLFQNLISNSIKFRTDEKPVIKIFTEPKEGYYHFSVQDNGIGIDMKYKDKIFQIFSRLHSDEKYHGAGIGLALCKRIVERHQGKIWIESAPRQGTTIHFTLAE